VIAIDDARRDGHVVPVCSGVGKDHECASHSLAGAEADGDPGVGVGAAEGEVEVVRGGVDVECEGEGLVVADEDICDGVDIFAICVCAEGEMGEVCLNWTSALCEMIERE
jgi:hypothetical protein